MSTNKDAKIMAKSLRGALADRNVSLSHSECLEIVARQFGFADWNTLLARLPAEEKRPAQSQDLDMAAPKAVTERTRSTTEPALAQPLIEAEAQSERSECSRAGSTTEAWSKCSFCGKSRQEVRTLMGGCGGWEGFRARGAPERSDVFICDECATFAAQIFAALPKSDACDRG